MWSTTDIQTPNLNATAGYCKFNKMVDMNKCMVKLQEYLTKLYQFVKNGESV